ncbi:hypothetical protein DFH08DRAFT_806917 [Mycena albidolilacea]|uniref:Uncharacterized protein n=1 Tax=Mycena albidolilacea TaxID=1033008 RepID=A0AAD7A758_9AGAR|nr:hypothetical protein DFH08DRAFT_806917 [Mycena albidolilacea]
MPPRKKQTRNISGLKNQGAKSTQSPVPNIPLDLTPPPSPLVNPKRKNKAHVGPNTELHPTIYFDNLQVDWSQEEQDMNKSDIDSELESVLKKLAYDDLEWLPAREAHRQSERKEHPKTYATGPDILKKAPRTQQHYRKVMLTQTRLDGFLFAPRSAPSSTPVTRSPSPVPETEHEMDGDIASMVPRIRRASASPEQSAGEEDPTAGLEEIPPGSVTPSSGTQTPLSDVPDSDVEDEDLEKEIQKEIEAAALDDEDMKIWDQDLED